MNQKWIEIQKLTASIEDGSKFGDAIDISEDTALIGAPGDTHNNTQSGAAYVFTRTNDIWTLQTKLVSPNPVFLEFFGRAVSIDGNTALISGSGRNAGGTVYVFLRYGNTWIMEQELYASDGEKGDHFGYSIALEGDTAIIGAPGDFDSGSAYIFTRQGNTWVEHQKIRSSDGEIGEDFGYSVSMKGNTAIIGAPLGTNSGCVYIYTRSIIYWKEQAKLIPSDGGVEDYFGFSVSIDGNTALIGAILDDELGEYSGSAYFFTRDGNTWREQQKILASDGGFYSFFGVSVTIQGNTAFIGAQVDDINGSVYVFNRFINTWLEQPKLKASDGEPLDIFGYSVALEDNTAIIGAPGDDDNGYYTGSVYVFKNFNNPPYLLNITGPISGKPGIILNYDFTNCVDPDGDNMTYYVDWGDGVVEEGFVVSEGSFTLSHIWNSRKNYLIKAKLIDNFGAESDWTTFPVKISRIRFLINPHRYNFLERIPIFREVLI